MRFLVEAQLPLGLAGFIGAATGFEAISVRDVGLREALDTEIWNYALTNEYIIVTKDEGLCIAPYPRKLVRKCFGFLLAIQPIANSLNGLNRYGTTSSPSLLPDNALSKQDVKPSPAYNFLNSSRRSKFGSTTTSSIRCMRLSRESKAFFTLRSASERDS